MMYDTAVTFRTSSATKEQAQQLFADLGMDMSTAMNVFLAQAIREERIPFEITRREEPNAETWAAIDEVYNHPEKVEGPYTNMRDLRKALYDA